MMVEIVKETVEKFKSLNGKLYDTLQKAECADKEWTRKQDFDPTKEVEKLEKECVQNFNRKQKRIDSGRDKFPDFWELQGKYGSDYYMCNSFDDMEKMGWTIFNNNFDFYQCDTDEVVATVNLIKDNVNKKAALVFVLDRSSESYEYETLDTIYMTVFGEK